MDCAKVGGVIRKLRLEKGMTQKELADKMFLSDKTISKWERGQGCPDVTLLSELSHILEVNVEAILAGDLSPNSFVGGSMKNSKYYVCPTCSNITLCTGNAAVSCCGRKLEPLKAAAPDDAHRLSLEQVEDDWFVTSKHPMEKEHHISFLVLASGDRVRLFKQYPEWAIQLRFSKRQHGKLMWYCTCDGLFYMDI